MQVCFFDSQNSSDRVNKILQIKETYSNFEVTILDFSSACRRIRLHVENKYVAGEKNIVNPQITEYLF